MATDTRESTPLAAPDRPKIATRDAYGEALEQLGSERDDIVVLDADLSGSTWTVDEVGEMPWTWSTLCATAMPADAGGISASAARKSSTSG